MNTTCGNCDNRAFLPLYTEGMYCGGVHYCKAYKKRISEVNDICVKYKKKENERK